MKKQATTFELTITQDNVTSTDSRFTMDRINDGDQYEPIDAVFVSADGSVIGRKRRYGENKISNQTLPRLAFQIFEDNISRLSSEDKEQFPICQYTPNHQVIRGIFSSKVEAKNHNVNPFNTLTYHVDDNTAYVIYSWNLFSTFGFVKECLRRFGKPNDKFILKYREKTDKEKQETIDLQSNSESKSIVSIDEEMIIRDSYILGLTNNLIESKNIILHGAPGTGKTYTAKQIAADIISDGTTTDFNLLSEEQKKQCDFVQFHPSYDYTDFVEGLRPVRNGTGNSIGFDICDGIFKRFITNARINAEQSRKDQKVIEKEVSARERINRFLSDIDLGVTKFTTIRKSEFVVDSFDDKGIYISIPNNPKSNSLRIRISELERILNSDESLKKLGDITKSLGRSHTFQDDSYLFVLYNEIINRTADVSISLQREPLKKYIFIIDEINRGEISKIFGELFFSIDPGYRGEKGSISTQYSNMHDDPNERFYIPENVYIIGTMNDIDRSVDSFDFAMRRRFRFVEITAEDSQVMLYSLGDKKDEAVKRMNALNKVIADTDDLGANYQIGAAYFLKLETLDHDTLWKDYLCPLLHDYVQGMSDAEAIMNDFENAYYLRSINVDLSDGETNENDQNQG